MLQYITDNNSKVPVTEQIFDVIKGGCKWVQIATKGLKDDDVKKIVETVKPECIDKEIFLLLNSRVDLAKELNVGGVYLKEGDEPCSHARMVLGPAAVIGVEVSSMADVLKVSALDIDYFGIGPFSVSSSSNKENEKTLDLEAIKKICSEMESREINIPKVATGYISLEDVEGLIDAGVNGVAVSDAISRSEDLVKETELFVKLTPKEK